MKSRLTMPTRVRLVLAAALCVGASVLTSGCSSVGAASGAAAGVASGLVTANPAIGIGVGIAVQAATDEAGERYRGVVLSAFQQVEDNLALLSYLGTALDEQRDARPLTAGMVYSFVAGLLKFRDRKVGGRALGLLERDPFRLMQGE